MTTNARERERVATPMSDEFSVGSQVKIKEGVSAPDLPEFTLAGWTGTVMERAGKKNARKYMIEWDQSTLDRMPPKYLKQCQEQKLYHLMVCLTGDALETVS